MPLLAAAAALPSPGPLQPRVGLARHARAVRGGGPVCRDGPRAFRTTDGGFFGAGSYFAVELEYATRYAMIRCRCARPVTGRPLPLDTDYQAALEGVDASEWRLCAHDVPA